MWHILFLLLSLTSVQCSPPVSVYFAPYSNVSDLSTDLSMCQNIVREANATGSKDYSIRMAVYNLLWDDYTDCLLDAHQVGVHVQILMDGSQLAPNRTWNTDWRYLVKHGFRLVPSQLNASHSDLEYAQIVGITMPARGLMHLKTRLYQTPKWTKLVTGSFNPESAAFINNETMIVTENRDMIECYTGKYYSVLYSTSHDRKGCTQAWPSADASSSSYLDVFFTPVGKKDDDAGYIILQRLGALRKGDVALLSVYSLHNFGKWDSFLSALERAHKAGALLYGVTELEQVNLTSSFYSSCLEYMTLYTAVNPAGSFNAMHSKNAVFLTGTGTAFVATDTANWSVDVWASRYYPSVNDESSILMSCDLAKDEYCSDLSLRFVSNALALLRFYEYQQNATLHLDTYASMVESIAELDVLPQPTFTFTIVNCTSCTAPQVTSPTVYGFPIDLVATETAGTFVSKPTTLPSFLYGQAASIVIVDGANNTLSPNIEIVNDLAFPQEFVSSDITEAKMYFSWDAAAEQE